MEAISTCWVHSYHGRHLPIHVVPKCYAKASSSRRRHGSCCRLTKPSESAIKLPSAIRLSIFLHGETSAYRFLPRSLTSSRKVKTSATRRRRKSSEPAVPSTPPALALSKDDKDDKEDGALQNPSEGELGCSLPQIAPYWSGSKGPGPNSKEVYYSFLRSTLNVSGGSETEIIPKEILSQLKAVHVEAAAAKSDKNHWVPIDVIAEDDHKTLRAADWNEKYSGKSLAVEDEQFLQSPRGLRRPFREKGMQLENRHDCKQLKKETRRSLLKHCLPPSFDRLGFQFPPKLFSQTTGKRNSNWRGAARVNLTVSYQMSYVQETEFFGLNVVTRERDMEVLDHGGILESHAHWESSSQKIGGFPRPVNWRTSPRGMTSGKKGRERGNQVPVGFRHSRHSDSLFGALRSGRFQDAHDSRLGHSAGSGGGRSGASSRVPVRKGSGRRLWSRADSRVEQAGNLFKDWLPIIGLVAFVVSGTYAFAVSHRYMKSGLWFQKAPSVSVARSAREPNSICPDLLQTGGAELTDDTFFDTIQKRPTFVLFYAPWCPYCQLLDPMWKELETILSKKGYDIQLARLNVEKHPNVAQNFKVARYPTLIFFKDGINVDTYVGPRNNDSFMHFIDEKLHQNL